MPSIRRAILLAAMVAGVPAVAHGAPPAFFTEQPLSRGSVIVGGTMVPAPGRDLSFTRYTVEPGASTGWHDDPGAVLFVVDRGTIAVVEGPDCREQTYGSGQAGVSAIGRHLLQNRGTTPAEVIAVHVALPPGGPTPYVEGDTSGPACAARVGSSSVEVLGRGLFDTRGHGKGEFFGDGTQPIEVRPGLDVTVQAYTWGPGGATPWHNHPGPAVGVVTRGHGAMYEGRDGRCEVERFRAGDGLVFFPQHAHWYGNSGTAEDHDLVTAYVNVPRRTDGVVPGYKNSPDSGEFRPPPASCPVPFDHQQHS